MEVDGMYENTPWERLALYSPWIALGILTLVFILFLVYMARNAGKPSATDSFVDPTADPPLFPSVAGQLVALCASLATLGYLFTRHWRAAHDTYPRDFGHACVRTVLVSIVIGMVIWILWRSLLRFAASYSLLTATAAAAAAVSAFSRTIIAEGQVTAMVLPIGFVTAAIVAELVAGAAMTIPAARRDPELHDVISTVAFLGGAYFMAEKLPVVQFHADSSLYPVTGAFYIVTLGRLSRMWILPWWGTLIGAVVSMSIGYMLAHWYGIAIAAVGLSIAGALGPRRYPQYVSEG